ncbi:MAG: MBL fold metallo-hydrolase [Candidatus Bathyarchaeia archaeon]
MRFDYIGHSTFLITIRDGTTILTDPWFGSGGFMMRRAVEPAIRSEASQRCDLMIASHAHDDHLDEEAIGLARRLGSVIVGPRSVGEKARRGGVLEEGIRTLETGESCEVRGVMLHAVPARHVGEAVGFVAETVDGVFYHSGDTTLFDELRGALSSYTVDVAMVTIGGLKVLFKKVMMDYRDAASLVSEIRPRVAIPMHYGTFRGIDVNPIEFERAVRARSPDTFVKIMKHGDTFEFSG